MSGDSWREARRAAGGPRASLPGAGKAGRPGFGTRTPCPCPGAEGVLPPAVGGRVCRAGTRLGDSAQVLLGGAAGSPGRLAQVRGPSAGDTSCGDRVGAGERPGAQVGEEELGTRTLSQWEGGKKSF